MEGFFLSMIKPIRAPRRDDGIQLKAELNTPVIISSDDSIARVTLIIYVYLSLSESGRNDSAIKIIAAG